MAKSAELALILSLVDEVSKIARGIKSDLAALGKESQKTQGFLTRVGQGLASLGKTAIIGGLAAATVAVTALFAATAIGVKEAIAVESAFAGVIKTTDGLADSSGKLTEVGRELKSEFRALAREIPTDLTDLMGIGEMGGQLGVAREGLISFTRTIAMMGETTNLAGDQAATAFAQIGNIMGTIEYDRMGSSIVELGNNFATTEADIANFAQRIAGAGKIAGLSTADIFGIGAAFASVGIEAEAGGTAVQKVLMGMNAAVIGGTDDLVLFAKAAGMSASEFSTAWEADAGAAFSAFVQGLGASGDAAIGTLTELGLTDQRLVRGFLSLANAGDLVDRAIRSSNEAWTENTALAAEAAQRYATTESQLAIIKNILSDVALSLGEALLPTLRDVLAAVAPLIAEFAERLPALLETYVIPVIQTVTGIISALIGNLQAGMTPVEAFKAALAEFLPPGLAAQIGQVVDTIAGLATTIATFVREHSEAFKAALIAIGAVLAAAAIASGIAAIGGAIAALANPVTLIIAAVGLLAAAWAENWGDIRGKTQAAIDWLTPFITGAIEWIRQFWADNGEQIIAALGAMWDWIVTAFQNSLAWITQAVADTLEWVRAFWNDHVLRIIEVVRSMWETVSSAFQAAVDWISGFIQSAIALWQAWWSEYGDNVSAIFQAGWDIVRTIFETVIGVITSVYQAFRAAFEGDWYAFGQHLRTAWDTLWAGIWRVLQDIWTIIKNYLQLVVGQITDVWNGLKDTLERVWSRLWENIQAGLLGARDRLVEVVRELPGRIIAFFTETDWGGVGRNIIQGVANGITDAVGVIKDAARKAAQSALDAAKGFLGISSPSRVAAAMIGEPFVEGIGAGIDRAMHDLSRKQLADLSTQMVKLPAQQATANAGGGGGIDYERLGAAVAAAMRAQPTYQINANYSYQDERSLRDDLRLLQMLGAAT